jgi:serine phosphatase RsbU (regulator of sigma subunit)/pimeloyl-ACP methyl ester carboxylesterase
VAGRHFPFKYKLALGISAVILVLLAGVFLLIENFLRSYVTAETREDLITTRTLVSRLLEERRARLHELGVALAGDALTRTLLTDRTLDGPTRDDVVENEILPNYPQLGVMAVLDANGSTRALSGGARALEDMLRGMAAARRTLDGEPALGFIRNGPGIVQVAAVPVRIGPPAAREVIGAVVVGRRWSMAELESIRQMSRAEVAFYEPDGIFLASGPPFTPMPGPGGGAVWEQLRSLPDGQTALVTAGAERFIVMKSMEPGGVSAPYLVARSLDRQLGFMGYIRRWLLELGLGGILVGCAVSLVLALGISRPIHQLQEALRRVSRGDFSEPARIRSRDEFAELAEAFNRMQAGLIERESMRRALLMAEEVQRNLLPAEAPRVPGLDVAGASVYCQAIGGDYYDFLTVPGAGSRLRVVLADVCGHGTAAALLMASSRALLRSRALHPGSVEEVVGDVNRELALDMRDSGRFVTLLLLEIDPATGDLRWVRAGHDPALLYDPATGSFENLPAPGMALGVDLDQRFQAGTRSGLREGQVLVLGTDGLWEARGASGAMYGKARLYSVLRQHAGRSAAAIVAAVLDDLRAFKDTAESEDDATLVVVKRVAGGGARSPAAPDSERTCTGAGGVPVHVSAWDGGTPSVLAVHGLTANSRCWDLLAGVLSPTHRLLAVDLRGRGRSGRPATGYSPAAHVGDLVGVLDGLGLERAVLMGHSLGAFIALAFAAEHPDRVAKLVLVDGGGDLPPPQMDRVMAAIRPALDRLGRVYPDAEAYLRQMRASPYLQPWSEACEPYCRYELEATPGGVRVNIDAAHIAEEAANLRAVKVSDYYGRVRCPVLILRATEGLLRPDDILLPPETLERLLGALPQARHLDVTGTNHYGVVFQPHPARDRALLDFLRPA